LTLGEVLDGDRMAKSMFKISFRQNIDFTELCDVKLTKSDVHKLEEAIEDLYYFEFIIDDIPLRGFLGTLEELNIISHLHKLYVDTHYQFYIYYNDNKVIIQQKYTFKII
jgi:transmembrane 9 superfamily member 1